MNFAFQVTTKHNAAPVVTTCSVTTASSTVTTTVTSTVNVSTHPRVIIFV